MSPHQLLTLFLLTLSTWALLLFSISSGVRLGLVGSTEDIVHHHRYKHRVGPHSCPRCRDLSTRNISIAVLAPNNDSLPYSLNKILPSIIYAVKSLQKVPNLSAIANRSINILYRDSDCSSTTGPLAAFDFYIEGNADVFFGPMCPYVLAPVARYSAVWDIPLLTSGGQNDNLDHRFPTYRTLTRMNGSYSQIGIILLQILRKFHWQVLGMLYHNFKDRTKGNSACYFTLAAVFAILGTRPFHRDFDQTDPETDYKRLLEEISKSARIVVMCASSDSIREIMLAADDLGMAGSGEYVFFSIELFTSKQESRRPWFREDDTDERNEKAKRAYEALLTVTARVPDTPEYARFAKAVKEIAAQNYGYDYKQEEVNTFVTAFHEAVILYAIALNETISDGYNITNGTIVTKKMWNRTFEGITGNVSIDENGDRNADYSLLDMDPNSGNFEVVANYFSVNREVVDVPGKRIHWSGGRETAPPDTPDCGFDGSICIDEDYPHHGIISAILSALLIALCILSFLIFRHYKLEAELASMSWRIKWEDILTNDKNRRGKKLGSISSINRPSVTSTTSSETINAVDIGRQHFIRTGYYKGTVVAIKPMRKTKVEVTRSLMLEMKKIKDLQHDHIVRFIGACVDPPHMCLITEYCPKGSLMDILENDQIKLDWMFRYSLMHDIVKGMSYLHSSEIRSHGNLKSTNCVVDSRFVLKITDFGCHQLRIPDENFVEDDNVYWKRKLWTAPELLRLSNLPFEGTQKGDVYSFGIIVHEIVCRKGTFHLGVNSLLTPQEIVENVKNSPKPGFRPNIQNDACDDEVIQLMQRCWSEDPVDRPDFQALKSVIRRLNSNESGNILDNLLSRMEQYANNLETLVEERTADYLEEKRKAEDLLYQLLPKSVASQLIKGDAVTAEAYDSVTIYFSDIVGFTSLSAQSTPMQVVTLLNDLYTHFDSIVENFDVYKVETIGDAYMVVSGLPTRNGILHAREIARMSLTLLNAVMSFTIRHRPGEQLKLRIGVHSGPCVAGVVGLKMPRYCLFGDTVNTASRMESTGMPLKIHVSPKTRELLLRIGNFILDLRGEVEMKGKGIMTTYWLLGETDGNGKTIISAPTINDDIVKETNL
ncbi:atrial natriuretic peptide receptor 1 isoform X2 [Tetranychus urticae]|uniref:Guanylate cyclase n=1 Tax=Tetranychus urticae TaxID=32264 RepID=T1KF53_TETUR|nr:atrial natriuretic peptide receptor 1 isoform X2 [Tetranychus urticae]